MGTPTNFPIFSYLSLVFELSNSTWRIQGPLPENLSGARWVCSVTCSSMGSKLCVGTEFQTLTWRHVLQPFELYPDPRLLFWMIFWIISRDPAKTAWYYCMYCINLIHYFEEINISIKFFSIKGPFFYFLSLL